MAGRIGVLGGTFDPIHFGHLFAASEVAHRLSLDSVIFVPTGQPWQKVSREVSSAQDRYAMTVLATEPDPRFEVSRVDIDRAGPTYTQDTLTDLREELGPECEIFFITGADALSTFATWHEADQVASMAHFVGVNRPGHRLEQPAIGQAHWSLVEIPALAISSTQCRERVAAGLAIEYLVPPSVCRYIETRGLYK